MIREPREGRPPRSLLFAIALLVGASPSLGTPQAAPAAAAEPMTAEALVAAVATAQQLVEQIRGVPFTGTVPASLLPEKDLGKLLETKLTEDLPVPFDRYAACMAAVGLIDPVPDLELKLRRLYTRQVAGFYDPAEKRFYLVPERMTTLDMSATDSVVDPLGLADLVREALLTHELTHALQDRRLDLYPRMKALRTNTDALLALQAMLEGEATVVMSEALLSRLPPEAKKLLGGGQAFANLLSNLGGLAPNDVEGAEGVPDYFIKELLFPYTAGAAWIQARKRSGGWAGVEEAYRRLPETTSEILHPGKSLPRLRLASREIPRPEELPTGARPLFADTLGEWVIGVLLGRAGVAEPAGLAAEWQDDRLLYYQLEADGSYGFLWRIRLTSPAAAQKLSSALAPLYAARLAQRRPVLSVQGSRLEVRTPALPSRPRKPS